MLLVCPADHSISALDNDQTTIANIKSMCFHPIRRNLKKQFGKVLCSETFNRKFIFLYSFLEKNKVNVCTASSFTYAFPCLVFLRGSFKLTSISIQARFPKWNDHKCCRNGEHTATFKFMFQVLNGDMGQKRPSAALKFEHGNLQWKSSWSIVLLPVVCV